MKVISVNDVHKKFRIYHDKSVNLKERILYRKRNLFETRWVLRGINFEVQKGETIGLIGQNGCGKSTLLKLLTRIIYPDNGSIEIKGRVSSLIELGAGFHPDMTGRENIYTNAAIFGLTKKEIDSRLEDIIQFSELQKFVDSPVRTYSSGMYMRLAFSVAINVDADILLIDEILSVGDTNFQKKCFQKLDSLKRKGVTIVIVSHDLHTIETFCNKAIWLNDGVAAAYGGSRDVVNAYLDYMNKKVIESSTPVKEGAPTEDSAQKKAAKTNNNEISAAEQKRLDMYGSDNHRGTKEVEITDAYLTKINGERSNVFVSDEKITVNIEYLVHKKQDDYIFGFGFCGRDRMMYFGTNTQLDGLPIKDLPEKGKITAVVNKTNFLSGEYLLHVSVKNMFQDLDYYRFYCNFQIVNDDRAEGLVLLEREWKWQ